VRRPRGLAPKRAGGFNDLAELGHRQSGLAQAVDLSLEEAGLALAKPGKPAVIGWQSSSADPDVPASPVRLFPAPDLRVDQTLAVAFPASPVVIRAWCGLAGVPNDPVVGFDGTLDAPSWKSLRRDALAGMLPLESVLLPRASYPDRSLPPEVEERNRQALKTLGSQWRAGQILDAGGVTAAPTSSSTDRLPSSLAGMSDLEAFWRTDGFLRKQGLEDVLLPSAADSLGLAAPGSSAAIFQPSPRERAPRLHPMNCTACGSCWATCPTDAITPRTVRFERVLADGLSHARPLPTRLPRLVRSLGVLCSRLFRDDGLGQYRTLDALVTEALERLLPKTDLSDEEQDEARAELGRLALPSLPLVEAFESTDRALFLGVDPDRCSGCGLCAEACAEDAWEMVPGAEVVDATEEVAVPIGGEDLEALMEAAPATRIGVTRAVYPSDGMPPGLNLVLRQVLSVLAASEEAVLKAEGTAVTQLQRSLEAGAQKVLNSATQINDFEALTGRLDELETGTLDAVAAAGKAEPLAKRRLRELSEARSQLNGLDPERQAPLSLLITPEVPIPEYPENPFAFPWMRTADPAPFAEGLLEASSRNASAAAERIRTARLAADLRDSGDSDALASQLTTRVVVVTTVMTRALEDLLAGSDPVTVLLVAPDPLDALDEGPKRALVGAGPVAQVSPAFPDHLATTLANLNDHRGPSLVCAHAPQAPEAEILKEARLAVASGVWPLLSVSQDGAVRRSRPESPDGPDGAVSLSGSDAGKSVLDWMVTRDTYREAFEFRYEHGRPSDAVRPAEWLDGAKGTPVVQLDAKRIAVPTPALMESAQSMHHRIQRLRDLLERNSDELPGDSLPQATSSAGTQADSTAKETRSVEDPTRTLARRLLALSGFGNAEGQARPLRDFATSGEEGS
ncbi:MAG: 4Fe-4S binding protein, partial [Rhodothermales bacterium]|nr:4Fe-4S binding protein [Rhodothermales bacterium]